jgi:hypothetical protein
MDRDAMLQLALQREDNRCPVRRELKNRREPPWH